MIRKHDSTAEKRENSVRDGEFSGLWKRNLIRAFRERYRSLDDARAAGFADGWPCARGFSGRRGRLILKPGRAGTALVTPTVWHAKSASQWTSPCVAERHCDDILDMPDHNEPLGKLPG